MTEVRRFTRTREEIDTQGHPYEVEEWCVLASDYDALAARVQAVERQRDEAVTRSQDIVSALGFKRECWKAPSRGMDVVLEDAKRLRPEMAKARQRVREIEGSMEHWFDEEFIELNAGPSSEMLLRIWRKAKETAQQLAEAQGRITELEHEANWEGEQFRQFAQEILTPDMRVATEGPISFGKLKEVVEAAIAVPTRKLTQAEQQVARLRHGLFVLKHEAQAVADDCHTPRYARLDEALESASTILRETGEGKGA